MSKKKGSCKCPKELQKICKHSRRKGTDSKDMADIIQALAFEDYVAKCKKKKRPGPPKFKLKPFVPPHFKDTCVPMKPSMHTRLRFIGHCPLEPERFDETARQIYSKYSFPSSSGESVVDNGGILRKDRKKSNKKKVRYYDLTPADILLPTPEPIVKHTPSDKSILSVPSPKTSGEVIRAERAAVKPSQMRPPLPPKSGHELYKPHSGIVLNRDQTFVPDVVHVPGTSGDVKKSKKSKPCYKGGVCKRKKCSKKKCRHYAKLKKRKLITYLKRHPHSSASLGATDGTPRARGKHKFIADDNDSVCGLDEIPKQDHIHIPLNLKRGTIQTHSLTVVPCSKDKKTNIHYGILTGSFNMYDTKFSGRSRGRQALPMSVMAYCLAFHYHPKQWTMKLVDNLVDAGDTWYLQCLDKVHDHSSVQGICEVLPFGKKQIMVLNGKRMQVLLCEPDIVGYTMSIDPTVYNLCRGLKAFFKENRAGILLSRVLKLVIWKDKVCYYIFDPAGRDTRAYSNFAHGQAALMNVQDIVSVAEVLLARSILQDQKFVLAAVKVLKMANEKCDEDFESDKELTQAEKAMMGYRMLSEKCAIVNANMHLGDRCFEEAKFRQALPNAVVAMTYAKISPPNTWFSKTLDKILRLGNKLYVDCTYPKVMIDITIDNIPNEIMIGPYACEIIIYRERVKGQLFTTKECLFNIRTGLADFFSHEYNSGILEFNNYVLAVWRQKDMFYLFDPYPRTTDGARSMQPGKACCLMLLNPDAMADAFIRNWDYLPATTQFYLHAFKVLKLKKKQPKIQLMCKLSEDDWPTKKRKVLPSKEHGDGKEICQDVLPVDILDPKSPKKLQNQVDEEQMGDIISLVDSIQEDYVPAIPMRHKKHIDDPVQIKVVNLDSPTVSVTQVVPPWPKPRDKTNEPIEPDPDPIPTPPPTPPPPMPPEGAEEEEAGGEEEEDEDSKGEAARRKAEEEEARRKAEELPPPMAPPPPSPQPEAEVPLAPMYPAPPPALEEEDQALPALHVDRRVLLTEDAQRRFKLRQIRKKITPPLMEHDSDADAEQELMKLSNFKDLPDTSQIIRGNTSLTVESNSETTDKLPFGAIMAIVTSYKYAIHTWTRGIVDFVVDTASKLYTNKKQRFQLAPVHIIPKIALGHQAFHATVDVIGEGATWKMEEILTRKFFNKYDRGMITTASYSCAIFKKNKLYYMFDGSSCNAMGLRDAKDKKGMACFLRFHTVRDLVSRINYNKGGKSDDQQFILSTILVRKLLKDTRTTLPEDHDFATGKSGPKSQQTIIESEKDPAKRKLDVREPKSESVAGYHLVDGVYRIEGTSALSAKSSGSGVKSCHFVCLIAMIMAAMHPIRTWDPVMIDICIEKGLEIHEKATNLNVCEKRVVKNVILDGKFMNINIKKILVVNENPEKRLEQYLNAVLRRLRYVIITYPGTNLVICQTDGYFHLFDPYPPPSHDAKEKERGKKGEVKGPSTVGNQVASWTLYRNIDGLIRRIRKVATGKAADNPEFYTFELTSIKTAPRHSALNYRLSPLFKPDINPNSPYLKRKRPRANLVDEKMYWLNISAIPWSRMSAVNDLCLDRKTPQTMWKDWDIEFPGDLYSLWGTKHPLDESFNEDVRGKQYLACCVVAICMTQACNISAWTSGFLDGIIIGGNKYHRKCVEKIGQTPNHEISLSDLDSKFDDMYPFSFEVNFDKIIFGFVYNLYPDRFNLSKALSYFFENESNVLGILTSPSKNLAFGKSVCLPCTTCKPSYFMFDCQSFGAPIFCPGQGAAYILKCESLNRLIYCMAITLNIRRHGQQFHLYKVTVKVSEQNPNAKA